MDNKRPKKWIGAAIGAGVSLIGQLIGQNQQDKALKEQMEKDYLDDYYDNVKDLTIYDYLQNGATGEVTHNENGTNRTWKSRRECFLGIVSFAESF